MDLWLRCFTEQEIAEAVGMPQPSVNGLLSGIRKFEIPIIPGLFTEDQPEEGATQQIRTTWEEARKAKILAMYLACHTQEEIAEAVGLTREGISKRLTIVVDQYRQYQTTRIGFLDWVSE
jgi:predicted XRE-type DNA-binding protein